MRLKLDENLGRRGRSMLIASGHDVATASEQGLCAAPDVAVIEVCRAEGRCLVTLDLDFSNPLRFEPGRYAGIAVLRVTPRLTQEGLDRVLRTLAAALDRDEIAGKLWIVEAGRVRQHQPPDEVP